MGLGPVVRGRRDRLIPGGSRGSGGSIQLLNVSNDAAGGIVTVADYRPGFRSYVVIEGLWDLANIADGQPS